MSLYLGKNKITPTIRYGSGGGTFATLISKTINSNGTYNATNDNADGYSSVTVDIQFTKQNKIVNPSITSQTITADTGYDALNAVTINPVTSNIDSNIISSNIRDGVTILGVTGTLVTDIPDTTDITGLFDGTITELTIPDNITSIRASVLEGCDSLQRLTIPFVGASLNDTTNTYFGYIFGATKYSENSDYVPSSLKEVIITGGTSIGNYAFNNCRYLTSITLPDSLTSMGTGAIRYCTSLTSITIPNSVTSLGTWALAYCSALSTINYTGTTAEWSSIDKEQAWNTGVPATEVICSDGTVTL